MINCLLDNTGLLLECTCAVDRSCLVFDVQWNGKLSAWIAPVLLFYRLGALRHFVDLTRPRFSRVCIMLTAELDVEE